MMRAGSWLMVSGGLAAGLGTAALGLAAVQGALAHAAALPALAAVAVPMGLASLALISLLGAPAAFRAPAAEARPTFPDAAEPLGAGRAGPRPAPHTPRAPSCPPVSGVAAPGAIGFAAFPIVGVTDGEPVAAVAIEPSFRDPHGRPVGAEAIDWGRVPARLRARLDDTLLARAAAFAELRAGEGRCCTVIVAVDATSLGDRGVADRLSRLFDRAGPGSRPPRLVVLARGTADDLDAYLALPRSWRDRLGLRLTVAPADEAALERCLAAEPGCLELDASLLAGGAGRSGRAARLATRLAGAGIPVVASGVRDGALLRDLRAHPALFARGPLFGGVLADAAVRGPLQGAGTRDAGVRRAWTSSESG